MLDPAFPEWIEVPDDYASLHILQLFLRHMPQEEKQADSTDDESEKKPAAVVDDENQQSSSIVSDTSVTVWDLDDCVREAGDDGAVTKIDILDPKHEYKMTNGGVAAPSSKASPEFENWASASQDCGSGQDRFSCRTMVNLRAAAASLETGIELEESASNQFQSSSGNVAPNKTVPQCRRRVRVMPRENKPKACRMSLVGRMHPTPQTIESQTRRMITRSQAMTLK